MVRKQTTEKENSVILNDINKKNYEPEIIGYIPMNEKDDIMYEIMTYEQGSFHNNKEYKNKYLDKINSNKENVTRSITQLFVHNKQDQELCTAYHPTTMETINELNAISPNINDTSKYHTEVKNDD